MAPQIAYSKIVYFVAGQVNFKITAFVTQISFLALHACYCGGTLGFAHTNDTNIHYNYQG